MESYAIVGPKPVRMFEVMIPKKIEYFAKLQDILETLFDPQRMRGLPFLQQALKEAGVDLEEWVEFASRMFTGYSIYEIDGRFVHPTSRAKFDERMLVIRIIFHDLRMRSGLGGDLAVRSEQAVRLLIADRLAVELGSEDEIWVLEYGEPALTIWQRTPQSGRDGGPGT
jgi:hypothetical protein